MEASAASRSRHEAANDVGTDAEEHVDEKTAQKMRRSLTAIDRQYEAQSPDVPRRIHIVGTGSIGKLVAHSLRSIPNPPPVTLLLHRARLLQAWEKSKKQITVEDDGVTSAQSGFDVELVQWERRQHGVELDASTSEDAYTLAEKSGIRPHEAAQIIGEQQQQQQQQQQRPLSGDEQTSHRRSFAGEHAFSDEPIHNLIVTTKAIRTVSALSAIKHRLTRDSTICFLQNGMGVIDDVNARLFPDEATRPNYVQGIITHGANVPPDKAEQDPFYVVHAGHGSIALGLMPRQGLAGAGAAPSTPSGPGTSNDGRLLPADQPDEWGASARYMLRTLTRSPTLCAVGFTPLELAQQQLEKLAVNSILNPLTVLLDARNGSLLYNFALTRTMRLLLAETSLVIRSLPELRGLANVAGRFSAARLETLVVAVTHQTRHNVSSMLADVRAGRQTEIEYINGYLVRRGEEAGIKCVVNYAIMQTVVGKCLMVQREVQDDVPLAGTEPAAVNRD